MKTLSYCFETGKKSLELTAKLYNIKMAKKISNQARKDDEGKRN
jgi:hypothetical protein